VSTEPVLTQWDVSVRWFVVAVSVRVIGVLLAAFEIALD
jgi:hypothetical protein